MAISGDHERIGAEAEDSRGFTAGGVVASDRGGMRRLAGLPAVILASSPRAGEALSLLRMGGALLFMAAGTMKLFGWPPPPPSMHGAVPLVSQLGLAAVLETFGGAAIVLGVLTRPVAFVLAGEMAWAYFQVHAPQGWFPLTNGGMPAVLFCFIFLYLTLAGAGPWSVDAWIQRRR